MGGAEVAPATEGAQPPGAAGDSTVSSAVASKQGAAPGGPKGAAAGKAGAAAAPAADPVDPVAAAAEAKAALPLAMHQVGIPLRRTASLPNHAALFWWQHGHVCHWPRLPAWSAVHGLQALACVAYCNSADQLFQQLVAVGRQRVQPGGDLAEHPHSSRLLAVLEVLHALQALSGPAASPEQLLQLVSSLQQHTQQLSHALPDLATDAALALERAARPLLKGAVAPGDAEADAAQKVHPMLLARARSPHPLSITKAAREAATPTTVGWVVPEHPSLRQSGALLLANLCSAPVEEHHKEAVGCPSRRCSSVCTRRLASCRFSSVCTT